MSPERPDWLRWEIGAERLREEALRNERQAIHKINGQRGADLWAAVETASKHELVQGTEMEVLLPHSALATCRR